MDHDDYKRLIMAWYTSKSMAEVSDKTGMDERKCSNIAAYLRKHVHIQLPPMRVNRKGCANRKVSREDKEELQRFAKMCESEAAVRKYRR